MRPHLFARCSTKADCVAAGRGLLHLGTKPPRSSPKHQARATTMSTAPHSSLSEPVAPSDKWWTPDTIAVVTGANQGIGKEIARQLASQGLTVVATARDPKRGADACAELAKDASVTAGGGRVVYAALDLADGGSSAAALADALRRGAPLGTRPGAPVAVLVNNAGLAYKGDAWGGDEAEATIGTNFRGTRAVTRALLPVMRESCAAAADAAHQQQLLLPRVVNVTSSAGGLAMFDRAAAASASSSAAPSSSSAAAASLELKRRFLAAGEIADEQQGDAVLDALAGEFEAAVRDGTWRAKGWPGSMYGVSKALENAWGRQLAARGRAAAVPSSSSSSLSLPLPCSFASINVHPGYIATSMSSFKGPLPPSRGADTPAWAALLPAALASAASGAFYHDRQTREY